jgi:serine protease Do
MKSPFGLRPATKRLSTHALRSLLKNPRRTPSVDEIDVGKATKKTAAARRACILLAALVLGSLLGTGRATSEEEALLARADQRYLEALGRAFNAAYEQVSPAVVLVTTTRHWRLSRLQLPRFHPSLPEEEYKGIGSGTIISPDGYILSNYHMIEDADSILVTLSDRRIFEAEVVGFDSLIDIALLKIQSADLPVVRLGDSDRLKVGDLVLAIGHPLGLGTTLTDGIISALGRQAAVIEGAYSIESFIQTNAVINPGNSGGPLLNLHGEVIGINTAISTRTGFYIGYGLAVPINLAHEAIDDILTYGRVVRSYLGVEMLEVSQELVEKKGLKLERPSGVYIDGTLAGSPAELSGLRHGDVILAIDERPVDRPNQVQSFIYNKDPGDTISLNVLRADEQLYLEVILEEREENQLLARGQERIFQLGITVQALTKETAREMGFTDEVAAELGFGKEEEAVVVIGVEPGGPAAAKGIQTRDIITEIDQQRITSVQQFTHFISGLEQGKAALFWFWRQDQGLDIRALRIPE